MDAKRTIDDRTIPDIHAHLEAERAAAADDTVVDEKIAEMEERLRRSKVAARLGAFVIGFSVVLLIVALPWMVHIVGEVADLYMRYWRWVER